MNYDPENDMEDLENDAQDLPQAMGSAGADEVDSYRGLIGSTLSSLEKRGEDIHALADQAGVGTTDPSQMSHDDLLQLGQTLAQEHPEVLQGVAQQFPGAQNLLDNVLGGGGGDLEQEEQSVGGGLLGKLFGA